MDPWPYIPWIVACLLVARWLAQLFLGALNAREARRRADVMPEALRGIIDEPGYRRSTAYTLANERFQRIEVTGDAVILAVLLFSGVLPWAFGAWLGRFGGSPPSAAAFLCAMALALSTLHWPLDWYDQFHLEERFGFNTMTPRLWWLDRMRGWVITLVLLYPLLFVLLLVAERAGTGWWKWAWMVLAGFQVLLLLLAPRFILPLFNRLSPLPDGPLRDRLLALAQRAGFQTTGLQVMDGSKRSRHSNAFFTGIGRSRRIVLYDTLIQQLSEAELEAVLAHEIGHYRLRHVHWMLLGGCAAAGFALWSLGWLSRQDGFYRAFDYPPGEMAAAFLLFGLVSGLFGFWVAPVQHALSRRFEYAADAFASKLVGGSQPLIAALRKLSEANLSNLTPHPLYARVYYSHPTLLEREEALDRSPRH